jgi:hypothetical protein
LSGRQEVGLDVFLATKFSPVLFRCKRGEYRIVRLPQKLHTCSALYVFWWMKPSSFFMVALSVGSEQVGELLGTIDFSVFALLLLNN